MTRECVVGTQPMTDTVAAAVVPLGSELEELVFVPLYQKENYQTVKV